MSAVTLGSASVDETRSPAGRLVVEVGRTADRLRSMGVARLGAAFEPEPTRAAAARAVAQRLANAAADLLGDGHRAVPVVAVSAAGDQVAVCGRDLFDAASVSTVPSGVVDATLTDACEALLDLRRRV